MPLTPRPFMPLPLFGTSRPVSDVTAQMAADLKALQETSASLAAAVSELSNRIIVQTDHPTKRDDPHETRKLVPIVTTGTGEPPDLSGYKPTDVYVSSGLNGVWVVVMDALGNKSWQQVLKGGVESAPPMGGQHVELSTDDDVYSALKNVLLTLGAEVN